MTPDQTAFEVIKGTIKTWWEGLTDVQNDGRSADRATLAQLRRLTLKDLSVAYGIRAFRELRRQLSVPSLKSHMSEDQLDEVLIIIVATLARVRKFSPTQSTMTLLGGYKDEDRTLREARFKRLIRAETAQDLYPQAIRLPALLKEGAPVGELGASLFTWFKGREARLNWARSYYHLDQPTTEAA